MKLRTYRKNDQIVSWLLRIGLAGVFAYAAVSQFRDPNAWLYFIPDFVSKVVDTRIVLDVLSVTQIILAVWLLVGKYLRVAAVVAGMMLAAIIAVNPGSLYITFRDFGLICMAAALYFVEEV